MTNVLTRKLELFGPLSAGDRRLLDDVVSHARHVAAHADVICESDVPSDVHLVLDGFACRYKLLPDGRRSIFAYLVPGDLCDVHGYLLRAMDHSIAALSPCLVVDIPRARVLELSGRPGICRALWWATLVDEAVLREWLVNLGRRDAAERISHLFCELHLRFKSVGLADSGGFELPLTQNDLADTMGLSTVHVNRSLQAMRASGLISFKARRLVILDVERLRAACGFNASYLHLDRGADGERLEGAPVE